MTIKEAIEILKDLRIYDDDCETDVEALTIAIDTLEKLEEKKLVELPCKVGDTVYLVNSERICNKKVKDIVFYIDGDIGFNKYAIGRSIFLTREEAEKIGGVERMTEETLNRANEIKQEMDALKIENSLLLPFCIPRMRGLSIIRKKKKSHSLFVRKKCLWRCGS